jgi:hypothetical protein
MERNDMRRAKLNSDYLRWTNLPKLAAVAILFTGCFAIRSMAQQPDQKTFASAEDASNALFMAAQNNDEKAMIAILGPDAQRIVSSGDDAEDTIERANFVAKYQQMHRFMKEPDGSTTLYIGAENWPTPIPLMNVANAWYFDTAAGKKEILYRRVGENELSAIRVCQELVAAEKEYYSSQQNVYAEKIFSDEGQHNGLYWKAAPGEPQSPIGPLVAAAVVEGYAKNQNGAPTPYHGYYFRVLTRQGPDGPGGAKSFIVDGKMTGGFAFEAYPASYRSSGVMTFIVGQDGVVYEKDFGGDTADLARAVREYNPSSGWRKDEDQQQSAAGGQNANQ